MVTLLLLQLTLAFPPGQSLTPLTLATAVEEADTLWSRYGVPIAAAPDCSAPAFATVVRVAIVTTVRTPGTQWAKGPLAAIDFDVDGVPAPAISLFLGDILRFVANARVLGARESQWPPAMRDRILGRAIGRVLAHEIGHYVLRTPDHSRAGLMRPVYRPLTLFGPERRPFALSGPEAARLAHAQALFEEGR